MAFGCVERYLARLHSYFTRQPLLTSLLLSGSQGIGWCFLPWPRGGRRSTGSTIHAPLTIRDTSRCPFASGGLTAYAPTLA
jgi:hypothetical protein